MRTQLVNEIILTRFLEDIEEGDTDLSFNLISDLGYAQLFNAENVKAMYKRQVFQLKYLTEKRKQDNLINMAAQKIYEAMEKNLERPVAYLKELFENNEIVFQHNKLEKLDVEEIKEMIKDMNYLELLERLEKENEEEQ